MGSQSTFPRGSRNFAALVTAFFRSQVSHHHLPTIQYRAATEWGRRLAQFALACKEQPRVIAFPRSRVPARRFEALYLRRPVKRPQSVPRCDHIFRVSVRVISLFVQFIKVHTSAIGTAFFQHFYCECRRGFSSALIYVNWMWVLNELA